MGHKCTSYNSAFHLNIYRPANRPTDQSTDCMWMEIQTEQQKNTDWMKIHKIKKENGKNAEENFSQITERIKKHKIQAKLRYFCSAFVFPVFLFLFHSVWWHGFDLWFTVYFLWLLRVPFPCTVYTILIFYNALDNHRFLLLLDIYRKLPGKISKVSRVAVSKSCSTES